MRTLRAVYACLVYLFLYLPLAVMVIYSFNDSRFSMVWKGFTLDWYVKLFGNTSLMQAALHSLLIAVLAATCSSILGTFIAMALHRWRFPSRKVIRTSLFVMMMSPDIVIGIDPVPDGIDDRTGLIRACRDKPTCQQRRQRKSHLRFHRDLPRSRLSMASVG